MRNTKTSEAQDTKVVCKCGEVLPPDFTGPCPKCGNPAKYKSKTLIGHLGIEDSLNWEKRREFYEKNTAIYWLIIAITIGSPIIGFFVTGLIGVFVGLVFGIVSYFLGPYAVTKVREIHRGSSARATKY